MQCNNGEKQVKEEHGSVVIAVIALSASVVLVWVGVARI